LPVEVPYVPQRRRLGYAIYAVLSGFYSYTVLYVVARFAGNVVRNFSPEWGFVPEIAVALLIFRSRIRLLVNFMKFLYLDKKDRIRAWFTTRNTLALGAAALVFAALPVWPDSVSGRFVLEPLKSAIVRARVPGTIQHVFVSEGQQVQPGTPLATLSNIALESEYSAANSMLAVAASRTKSASLQYVNYGPALKEYEQLAAQVQQLSLRNSELQLTSPMNGLVATPRVHDLLGSYRTQGSELLEVQDLSALRARIYISEYDLSKVHNASQAKLQVEGFFNKWRARVESIAERPTEMDPELQESAHLTGMDAPHFYLVNLILENPDAKLKPGMVGYARVFGRRRSALRLAWQSVSNFWGRKLW
jgi:putative peptide zinc metalloprotease protein